VVYVQEILDIMNICVVVPVYNESKTIAGIVTQVKNIGLDVLVIDDGSSDTTSEAAKDSGAIVLKNDKNEGKGASLIKGFNYALAHNFDAIITMDGDGQHEPGDIRSFVSVAARSDSGILIGTRMSEPKNMPLVRFMTNTFLSWFISCISGQDIPDTQCGFRLIKKEVLEKVKLRTNNYEAESELLIKAARLGFKIESLPIHTIYMGEKSRINPFVDSWRFVRLIVFEIFNGEKIAPR
jgi:glycosyltransferase involved in cell wall biosynthesis